jgi:creatinine amidohydrolase
MSTSSRRLVDLRAPEVATRLGPGSIAVQPIGAVEQHGPHLPLGTDIIAADAAAEDVVERFGEKHDLWLLPSLAYGKSNEHHWAPGTVWLSADTLLRVLDDIGRSVAMTPIRKLVFLNGHGGNSSLLNVACREIRLAHGLMTFLTHPSVPPDQGGASTEEEFGMGIHAGLNETSRILHLRPELVDMDATERHVPEWLNDNRHVRFGGGVSFGWLSDDFDGSGVIGDPTNASAELGKQHWEAAIDRLGEAFAEIAAFDYDR